MIESVSRGKVEVYDADMLVKMQKEEADRWRAIKCAIDALGEASAIAQRLRTAITTTSKLVANRRHTLYVYRHEEKVLGFVKCGPKHLYYWRANGDFLELDAICVLDFYVSDAVQRRGIGRLLFDNLLRHQRLEPARLAYDRPSPKLLPFLAKHYGLRSHVQQPNNFVIFDDYFLCD